MATIKKAAVKTKTPPSKATAKKTLASKALTAPKKKTAVVKKGENKITRPTKTAAGNDGSMLTDFFCSELKDIYWAEKHLLKVLPKMAKNATAAKLKQAFEDHKKVTEGHVTRLEQIFELMGQKAQAKKCEAMAGITKEGDDIINETEKGTETRDVGLILAAQKVEHYEIATYGGLAELARTIGNQKAASILEETLAEEKEADESLSRIAKRSINMQANEEPDKQGFFDRVMDAFN